MSDLSDKEKDEIVEKFMLGIHKLGECMKAHQGDRQAVEDAFKDEKATFHLELTGVNAFMFNMLIDTCDKADEMIKDGMYVKIFVEGMLHTHTEVAIKFEKRYAMNHARSKMGNIFNKPNGNLN